MLLLSKPKLQHTVITMMAVILHRPAHPAVADALDEAQAREQNEQQRAFIPPPFYLDVVETRKV